MNVPFANMVLVTPVTVPDANEDDSSLNADSDVVNSIAEDLPAVMKDSSEVIRCGDSRSELLVS